MTPDKTLEMKRVSKNIRHLFAARFWPGILAFWSWWSTELLDLLPERARAALRPAGKRLFLELEGPEIVASQGTEGGRNQVARFPLAAGMDHPVMTDDGTALLENLREIILCLPRDKVLVKPLELPIATEENLREVLAFEMDRQTPFTSDQVYYDYTVTARNPGEQTLALALVLTPRQELDDILATLAGHGIHPDQVTVPCDTPGISGRINLLPESRRGSKVVTPRLVNIALGMLVLALLAGAVSLPLLAQRHRISLLEPMLETAQTKAEIAGKLRDSVDRLASESRFLVNRKQTSLLTLQILDEITRILPDDTWVFQLQIRGPEVQIQGQSASAAALVPLIESSGILHNARFRSPVTQVPRSTLERFHLSATAGVASP